MRLITSALCLSTLFLLLLGSCKPDLTTTINGQIDGAKDLSAYLDIKSLDKSVSSLADAPIDENGNFTITLPEGIPAGLYRLRIGTTGLDLICDGTEKNINVTGKLAELKDFKYAVTGSALTETYLSKISGLIDKTIQRPIFDAYVQSADPLLAVALHFATTPLDPAKYELFEKMVNETKTKYPDVAIIPQLEKLTNDMKRQYTKMINKYPVKLGQTAPDIVLPGLDGKERKLSDLKGSVVLLDFWASWCSPCRRANPHVVELYHKYNKDGFEVFNVSLDGLANKKRRNLSERQLAKKLNESKKKWRDAIAQDKLVWEHHVGDLMGWESAGAQLYGVTSIPTTFLVDREGKIAAINPRGNLEQVIQENI